uniref:Uncharacterized protein n=1 Tax=uncultured bacterium fosmid pJB135F11 TaxID=1478051 RepID=A0A0H3U8M4_9BACT|nr:hypothetical protein [uncultured bacterium fosmid pJB135F11]
MNTSHQHTNSYTGRNEAHPETTHHEGSPDETPLRPHQLHRMDDETMVLYAQAHRVVDQADRYQDKQQCHHKQEHRHAIQVAVQVLHQVLLIKHLTHERIVFQLSCYPLQTVRTCV